MFAIEKKTGGVFDDFMRLVRRNKLIEKGDSLLVAFSGGPDSVCLFDMLYRMRTDWKLNLHFVHLNHSLRGSESDKDQIFAEKFARDLKMPISVKKVDVEKFAQENRLSLEEAGRECRLQFFQEEAERLKIKKVALGHHKDDLAETVLLRMLRGTGLRGLSGIKPWVEMKGMVLIRPLLDIEKSKLQEYLTERKLAYCVDASNSRTDFARNRIRHKLIPILERDYNPKVRNALAHLAETIALDLGYIEAAVEQQYPKIFKKKKGALVLLDKKKFRDLHDALKFRVLQKALRVLDPECELNFGHWNEIRKALEDDVQKFEVTLPNDLAVAFERKEVLLKKPSVAAPQENYEYSLEPGSKVKIRELDLTFSCEVSDSRIFKEDRYDKTCGIFDMERITFPITVRNRRDGDIFQPLGMKYTKKLKDFLIARKIPSYNKNQLPVFVSGEQIFWVYGVEIGERYKVFHKTRRFLKISQIK